MRKYDSLRANQLKQHSIIPKSKMQMPVKDIPVVIRPGLVIYTDSKSKIPAIRKKYAGK